MWHLSAKNIQKNLDKYFFLILYPVKNLQISTPKCAARCFKIFRHTLKLYKIGYKAPNSGIEPGLRPQAPDLHTTQFFFFFSMEKYLTNLRTISSTMFDN